MKFIAPIFGLIFFAVSASTENAVRRCVTVLYNQLDIPENSFVEKDVKYYHSQHSWYNSVNWKKIPSGPVLVDYYIQYFSDGIKVLKSDVIELFDPDYKSASGSIANLMRYALGIPKFSDIKLGQVKLDREMFRKEKCLNIYSDYKWEVNKGYGIYVKVMTRQNDEVLLKGHLQVIETK